MACKPKMRAQIVRKFGSIQTTEKRLGLNWKAFFANFTPLFFI